ncbi:hypothetical protein MRX96_005821 [Rhipicephalus microplus]
MISALAQNLGEFAAGRIFCLPGTIDTAAMVNITSFVGHLTFPVRDEAPMVRCALLNELVVLASNIKNLTQLPTRFGPSLRIDTVKRRVEGPGAGVPTGKIGCVDLGTYTRILGGSFILEGDYAELGPGTWGERDCAGSHGAQCTWEPVCGPIPPLVRGPRVLEHACLVLPRM